MLGINAQLSIDMDEHNRNPEDFEGMWRVITEYSSDYIFVLDVNAQVISINRDFLKMPRRELVGKKIYDFLPKIFHKDAKESLSRVLNTGETNKYSTEYTPNENEHLYFGIRVSPLFKEGEIDQLICVVTDKTAYRHSEYLLGERVKELRCLYGISKLADQRELPIGKIMQGIVDLIPPSWQYPDITCARIRLDHQQFVSEPFKETEWFQSQELITNGKKSGILEVFYLEEKPEFDEGPFLQEEWELINVIAERAGKIIGRKESEITKLKLESQLRQSQKMEAIGILTGGIAHEFNNLLAPIVGYADLLQRKKPIDHPDLKDLEQIMISGNRAKVLVQQMLAYGRQSQSPKESVDLETLLDEALEQIKSTLPSNILINVKIDQDLPPIFAMPNEIGQVFLNLCINAGHAMPDGGKLQVSLNNEGFREFKTLQSNLISGQFISLCIVDDGVGMDQTTLERIFDPFFTTKDVGNGSGLGLSVVQGIIEQHNGYIEIESLPGKGTTFCAYFPTTIEKAQPTDKDKKALTEGDSTILLVDDEPMLVNLTKDMLGVLGYKVEEFVDCEEALKRFGENPDQYDLILTDYGMPRMNGKQLIKEIKKIRPDIPAILVTGYGDSPNKDNEDSRTIKALLEKPFELEELSDVVRKALKNRN